jgi:hypothetical protein
MDAGPTATLIQERLEQLDTITVDRSSHPSFDDGHCSMEIVAWLAGEAHTAAPRCASPVIRAFTIGLNDQGGSEQRQKLRPYLPRMVGTIADGQDEARSYLALDWLIRTFTPAWLDLAGLSVEAKALRDLRRIVDLAAAGPPPGTPPLGLPLGAPLGSPLGASLASPLASPLGPLGTPLGAPLGTPLRPLGPMPLGTSLGTPLGTPLNQRSKHYINPPSNCSTAWSTSLRPKHE